MKAKRATNLQRQTTEIVADPNLSKKRAITTEYNEPSADLINAQDHELMQRRLKLLEGLSRGIRAALEGETYKHSDAKAKMSKWLKS